MPKTIEIGATESEPTSPLSSDKSFVEQANCTITSACTSAASAMSSNRMGDPPTTTAVPRPSSLVSQHSNPVSPCIDFTYSPFEGATGTSEKHFFSSPAPGDQSNSSTATKEDLYEVQSLSPPSNKSMVERPKSLDKKSKLFPLAVNEMIDGESLVEGSLIGESLVGEISPVGESIAGEFSPPLKTKHDCRKSELLQKSGKPDISKSMRQSSSPATFLRDTLPTTQALPPTLIENEGLRSKPLLGNRPQRLHRRSLSDPFFQGCSSTGKESSCAELPIPVTPPAEETVSLKENTRNSVPIPFHNNKPRVLSIRSKTDTVIKKQPQVFDFPSPGLPPRAVTGKAKVFDCPVAANDKGPSTQLSSDKLVGNRPRRQHRRISSAPISIGNLVGDSLIIDDEGSPTSPKKPLVKGISLEEEIKKMRKLGLDTAAPKTKPQHRRKHPVKEDLKHALRHLSSPMQRLKKTKETVILTRSSGRLT